MSPLFDWKYDEGAREWVLRDGTGWARPTPEGRYKAVYDGRVLGEFEDAETAVREIEQEIEAVRLKRELEGL